MAELCIIDKWAENLDEATVSRWLVAEGDTVAPGDALCEIITDKATFEYEVERGGIVKAIYCPARSTVPVGYVIAFIGEADEEPPDDIETRNAALMREHRARTRSDLQLDLPPQAKPRAGAPSRVRATPAARQRAREHGVSIEEVAAALGLQGVLGEEDVRRYLDMRP